MNNNLKSKHDIHPLDKYLTWLANRKLIIVVWCITITVGFFCSWYFDKWGLMPRFGCLGIMIGTLLTLSPLFYEGIYLSQSKVSGMAEVDAEGKTAATNEGGRTIAVNVLYGVVLIVASSIINAFGDLLGFIL